MFISGKVFFLFLTSIVKPRLPFFTPERCFFPHGTFAPFSSQSIYFAVDRVGKFLHISNTTLIALCSIHLQLRVTLNLILKKVHPGSSVRVAKKPKTNVRWRNDAENQPRLDQLKVAYIHLFIVS